MESKYENVPEATRERLKQLEGLEDEENFIKNVIAFYRFKKEGKFGGHEDQYVLISHEQIVGFYDTRDEGDDVSTEDEQAFLQPIDEKKTYSGRKRHAISKEGNTNEFQVI